VKSVPTGELIAIDLRDGWKVPGESAMAMAFHDNLQLPTGTVLPVKSFFLQTRPNGEMPGND
jgi:hypothetical protein